LTEFKLTCELCRELLGPQKDFSAAEKELAIADVVRITIVILVPWTPQVLPRLAG